jgi:hypothetical protein
LTLLKHTHTLSLFSKIVQSTCLWEISLLFNWTSEKVPAVCSGEQPQNDPWLVIQEFRTTISSIIVLEVVACKLAAILWSFCVAFFFGACQEVNKQH